MFSAVSVSLFTGDPYHMMHWDTGRRGKEGGPTQRGNWDGTGVVGMP